MLNLKRKTMAKTRDFKQGRQIFDSSAIPVSSGGGIPGYLMSNIGSAFKLLEDIKKDGFQWRDLGNFSQNSALDLLYMYPGMGIIANQNKNKISKQYATKLGEQAKIASTGNNSPIIPNAEQIMILRKRQS